MDEQEINEKDKPKDSVENTDDGVKSEADIKVEQLNADTERINKAIAENENAKARDKLSGRADAGQASIKKEETPKEYSDRVMNNTLK